MSALAKVFRFMLAAERRAFLQGWALSFVVLAMGAALLGLSGWFITAAAAAGLAGLGATFDVFRPSAMVRFLALGRAAARYGERLTTHDATLRTLAALRVHLLARLSRASHDRMVRLRSARALNRLMADVDALDGVPLRLILPIGAALAVHFGAFLLLWWLADLRIAAAILGIYLAGATAVFVISARLAQAPSAEAEAAGQSFRARFVDLIRARRDLMVYGRIDAERTDLAKLDLHRRHLQRQLDQIARRAGLGLSLTATTAGAAALWIGLSLAEAGQISVAVAAMGTFAALGLAETLAPLGRAVAEIGRMADAARRSADVLDDIAPPPEPPVPVDRPGAPVLAIEAVRVRRADAVAPIIDGLSLRLAPGEVVALTGPSGVGKSSLLELAGGLTELDAGHVAILGHPIETWPEPALRAAVTLVPQRAALVAGTVADNLRIAAPDAPDTALLEALDTVQLTAVLAPRGGLAAPLGPGGAGLSGGEARRLVLARALLRRPRLLLLDEPTEGLDRPTADRLLAAIRSALPETAILTAAHRAAEINWADRSLPMT